MTDSPNALPNGGRIPIVVIPTIHTTYHPPNSNQEAPPFFPTIYSLIKPKHSDNKIPQVSEDGLQPYIKANKISSSESYNYTDPANPIPIVQTGYTNNIVDIFYTRISPHVQGNTS